MSCSCDHHHNRYVVIKNPHSGLVLDARDYEVKLHHFHGHCSQLWKLECGELGRFIIINKETGKALDIQGGVENGNNIITYGKHGGLNQQWYINSNKTIVSAGGDLAIDIRHGKCTEGNNIIAFHTHGKHNQQFILEHHHC